MTVFLDTNVIIDVLAAREPFFADSQRVVSYCEHNPGSGAVSVLTFCTVAYVLRKAIAKDQLTPMLNKLRKIFTVFAMTSNTVDWAIDLRSSDFEDAMQYECARSGLSDVIVTRDKAGFKNSPIPVMTPAEFLRSII